MPNVVMRSIPKQVVELIRCPRCGEPVDALGDGGAQTGIHCPNGHRFGTERGYLDCSAEAQTDSATARTFASFGFEWNEFDEVRDEDDRFAEIYFRDLDLKSLDGKVGLDAGCGKGRFTRLLAAHLAAEVALDGSSAVEAAARNLGGMDGVVVIKSDLRTAPFAPGSFDFVSSLGVLHHLEDPRAGFDRLVELLAPGGRMLLYLYSRPSNGGARATALTLATGVRSVTVRMPHRWLKVLSTPIAAALYAAVVAPGRWGQRRQVAGLSGLPMDTYRDKPFRSLVLDTFDRLSAPVEFRFVWEELEPWFAEAGLVVDAARDETGWFIVAHRPGQ